MADNKTIESERRSLARIICSERLSRAAPVCKELCLWCLQKAEAELAAEKLWLSGPPVGRELI